jgi:hypothetical protein
MFVLLHLQSSFSISCKVYLLSIQASFSGVAESEFNPRAVAVGYRRSDLWRVHLPESFRRNFRRFSRL